MSSMASEKTFIAGMELYDCEDGVHAIIRTAGVEDTQEVVVPPHMAAMLPQAIAMMRQQAEIESENGQA